MGSISGLRSVKEGGCLPLINGYNIYTLTINQAGSVVAVVYQKNMMGFCISPQQAYIIVVIYIIKPLSRGGYE